MLNAETTHSSHKQLIQTPFLYIQKTGSQENLGLVIESGFSVLYLQDPSQE